VFDTLLHCINYWFFEIFMPLKATAMPKGNMWPAETAALHMFGVATL
jgi:hypothetical protein